MTTGIPTLPRILLLHNDPTEIAKLTEGLAKAGFDVLSGTLGRIDMDELFHHPPVLILLADGTGGRTVETILRDLKGDPMLGRLPTVVLVRDIRINDFDWSGLPVDDYLTIPYQLDEVVRRIRLSLSRLARSLDANPLTRLPGNTTILHETTRRIESERGFALAYLDVDNFKSFNDRYGYSRGDEVLVVTCRLLTTVVNELGGGDAFVGHVGGDDFGFITAPDRIDRVCETVIKRFDLVIPDFYDDDDRQRGYIESVDRKGNRDQFPLMSVSIAVITTETGPIPHPGDISKRVSELKKKAKAIKGSVFVKDVRDKALL